MAYLMLKKGYDLRSAYEFLKKQRAGIGPRSNFMAQLCRLEKSLVEQGALVKPMNTENRPMYSLPMQVYELSTMRCANYEEGVQFLFAPERKKGVLATVEDKCRDIADRW
jgi:hypothetical protein